MYGVGVGVGVTDVAFFYREFFSHETRNVNTIKSLRPSPYKHWCLDPFFMPPPFPVQLFGALTPSTPLKLPSEIADRMRAWFATGHSLQSTNHLLGTFLNIHTAIPPTLYVQEVHHMDGVLLEEPPPPLGVPSPPPQAVGPNGAEAASCRNIPSICEGVGCNRQAKFGYEVC